MARSVEFEVLADLPTSRGVKTFRDLLAAAWHICREEPVGPMERVGIGFQWFTRAREGSEQSTLPRPWSHVRNGLVERGAVSAAASIWMARSEVVHIERTDERPRLLVRMERA